MFEHLKHFTPFAGQTLIKSDKKLSGPGNSKLNVLGKFQCMLESQDKFSVQDIHVVTGRTTFCEMSHV
jgi:hypothetical protein